MKIFNWKLTTENTSPFVIVAVLYFLLLGSPFIYFLSITSQNHHSENAVYSAQEDEISQEEEKEEMELLKRQHRVIKKRIADSVSAAGGNPDSADYSSLKDFIVPGKKKILRINLEWRKDADSRQFVFFTRLAIFSAVLAFGALGAAVSLITRVRNRVEIGNITAMELVSIQTIGAIFAGILALIFIADLIGGRLFPEPELFFRIIYVHAAFAKLLIWSFIAGFSERFVPNILNNLIKKSESGENKTP